MGLLAFWCVAVVFFMSKTTFGHDDVLYPVATDHQPEEAVWSPGCPKQCSCYTNNTHHIISVDCSSRRLKMVPDLPHTTVQLTLRNNSIADITCESFKLLNNLEILDLASNNISRLQPCVFQSQPGSLVNHSISDNKIKDLDVKLFQGLSYLKTLHLSRNFITNLASRSFSGLVRLIVLDLSFNFIGNITPDAFKGLYSLKTLSLENNELDKSTSFHNDVFQDLGALETLRVKANRGSLNDAISTLKNLSHLYMTGWSDLMLGTGFQQLINLQLLDLGTMIYISEMIYKSEAHCFLQTVPSNFFINIQSQKDLKLSLFFCNIQTIESPTFQPLSTLVNLDLTGNSLMDFAATKQGWVESLIYTNITYLDLSGTMDNTFIGGITVFCSSFKDLSKTNLKSLVFKDVYISFFDELKDFPTMIEKLDVSENYLALDTLYKMYTFSPRTDYKLKELRASNQKFSKTTTQKSVETSDTGFVGGINSNQTRFKKPDCAGRGPEISDSLLLNGSLEFMFVDKSVNCPEFLKSQNITVICLPSDLEAIYGNHAIYTYPSEKSIPHISVLNNTVLRHVELANNPLTKWFGPIENVPALKFLDLSGNWCKFLSVDFFKYMTSLEILVLRRNILGKSLAMDVDGVTFSTLANLSALVLSENNIKNLSRLAFIHNTNLAALDLSNNRLTRFQPTMSTFHKVEFVDLSFNFLLGLSEETCEELKLLKSRNDNFSVNLYDNRLLFKCDYIPFLHLVISRPEIFFRYEDMQFEYSNGTKFFYKDLAHHFLFLARECQVQRFFIVLLITFFVVVGAVTISAVAYHKRWKLRYLYYMAQRRMHFGQHIVDYTPDADVFLTYDQDDLRWRHFMQQTFLPGLNQRSITYILGETDFPGGDLMAHVTGAVVGTRKTVVLLSSDIFDDHHREFEMNLSIMREMDTRSLKIVPIFVEEVDLTLYPREIELFLRNQWERCLSYRDTDDFWGGFVDAVREDN